MRPVDGLLREFRAEVEKLRLRLDADDQAEMDASEEEITACPSAERFSELLRKVAGIAAVGGEAGVPVVLDVRALLGAS